MLGKKLLTRCVLVVIVASLAWAVASSPASAAAIDPYVSKYLQATEPVELDFNDRGETKLFSAEDLSFGKGLFGKNCLNCHVGGSTLPDPRVPLSLEALKGATPPRDNISALVAYQRQPTTYDGGYDNFWCREVPESWLPTEQLEKLSAFILRAAQKAPGWGTDSFED